MIGTVLRLLLLRVLPRRLVPALTLLEVIGLVRAARRRSSSRPPRARTRPAATGWAAAPSEAASPAPAAPGWDADFERHRASGKGAAR